LVDAARDRSIPALLRRFPPGSSRSLYEERENPGLLESFAPHLAIVDGETLPMLDGLWGQGCVVFVLAPVPFLELRKHFRRFLMVKAEGKPVYFRFYDPRVLPTFLLNAETPELAEFFGPIGRLILESEDGEGGALAFERVAGVLKHAVLGATTP
jgi:hypothetical protein